MTGDSDRELDARLAAAAGFRDEDLPALPDVLLREIQAGSTTGDDAGPTASEPASVLAARQLVADAHRARLHPVRRSSGRRLLRRGVPLLATVAVGVVALVLATSGRGPSGPGGTAAPTATPTATTPAAPTGPPADLGPLAAPPGGLALAATGEVSFPYSLDPEPAGLTRVLSMFGGLTLFGYTEPVVWAATYQAADDPGFSYRVSLGDPRILPPGAQEDIGAQTTESQVAVGGVQGDLLSGDYDSPLCGYAPSTPEQSRTPDELCAESFAQLTWQRSDGMWVQVYGEDDWATAEAVVSVGESIVDRPQPVPLQVRLAPAGWSVSSYEDNTSLTLISDTAPSFENRIGASVLERWRGSTEPDLRGYSQGNPIERVVVAGRPAELVSVPDGSSTDPDGPRMWILEAELPGGLVLFFQAPGVLTHDQVLQIAAQVTYTP